MFRWFQLAKRVSELEEQMLKLTRIVEDKDLDWADMRARCKRLLDRTDKAAKRVVESEESVESNAGGEQERTDGHLLTPRQRTLQQQILRRRAGMP